MKPRKDVANLAEALTATMTTPPLTIAKAIKEPAAESPQEPQEATAATPDQHQEAKPTSKSSVSVFLRVPAARFAQLQEEATERTKATGKGVTVQQIILAKLEGGRA